MSTFENYLKRIHQLLASLSSVLTHKEQIEIIHLINHNECGEALRTLAWIIVEENKSVPISAIEEIKFLSQGLIEEHDLPPNLDLYTSD